MTYSAEQSFFFSIQSRYFDSLCNLLCAFVSSNEMFEYLDNIPKEVWILYKKAITCLQPTIKKDCFMIKLTL